MPRRGDPVSHIGYADCIVCERLFVLRRRRSSIDVNLVCRDVDCQRLQKNRQMSEWFRRYRDENGAAYTKRYHDKRKAAMKQYLNRKMSLPYEKFTDEEIFERDEWVCGICSEPVDKSLKWPDPLSKSLDHVTPLSRGGHHVWSNCQLAHVTCNTRKGNREEEVVAHGWSRPCTKGPLSAGSGEPGPAGIEGDRGQPGTAA